MCPIRHFADALPIVLLLATAACGDDSASADKSSSEDASSSTVTDGAGGATSASTVGGSGGVGGEVDPTPLPELRLASVPTQTVEVASMHHPRAGHTATLLDDGTVIVVGGEDLADDRAQLDTVERYDPEADTWTDMPSLPEGRLNHSSTLLVDGKILIVGGGGSNAIGSPSGLDVRTTALLLDPATGDIETIPGPVDARHGQLAVRLPSGKVLIAGGADDDSILILAQGAGGAEIPFGHPLASAEIYDPETKTFATTGTMEEAHASFTMVGLADGKVLVSGGINDVESATSSATSELFDEATGTFTRVGDFEGDDRLHHAATRLLDGRALIFGGKKANVAFLSDVQAFDPVTGEFENLGSTFSSRTVANMVPTSDGGALILGGLHCSFSGCEDPADTTLVAPSGSKSDGPTLLRGRASASATVLLDGTVLVAGGYTSTSQSFVERLMP